MSVLANFLLICGTLILMYAAAGTYFLIRQFKTYMKVLEPFSVLEMRQLGTILAVCFCMGEMLLAYLYPDKTWFVENNVLSAGLIAVAMGVVGLIPEKNVWFRILSLLLQFSGICATLFLFPKDSCFFRLTGLPFEANLVIVAVLWMSFLSGFSALNRLNGFFVQQFLIIGVFAISAFLFVPSYPFPFYMTLALAGVVGLGALPFFLSQIAIPLTDSARLFFNFVITWLMMCLIASGKIAAGVLLMAYPIMELVVFVFLWFVAPLIKKAPVFLFQGMEQQTGNPFFVVLFIFKRNFIFCLLAAIAMNAGSQIQPIFLGCFVAVEMYLRLKGTASVNMSWRGLFRQIKTDVRADFQNSKEQLSLIREKWATRKSEKTNGEE